MKNVFLCAALLAGSMFAFANEVEPTYKVEKLEKEVSFLEDDGPKYSNCNDYGYAVAMSVDTPEQTSKEFLEDQDFWIQACNDAGGCPCESLEPVTLN